MTNQPAYTLINPQNGNLAFKLFSFEDNRHFDHIQRLNYFSIIWIKKGVGRVKADFAEHSFVQDTLFAFTPYQPFMLQTNGEIEGIALNFHSEFFCIHKHHQEIASNGILFNNIYHPPFVVLDDITKNTFNMLFGQVKMEMQNPDLAQNELLISYLKIVLITASRLKIQQHPKIKSVFSEHKEPFVLQNLKDSIETYFKSKHSASDYADLLNITPKALAKLTKSHFNKTLTDLISERIVIEAKRELYMSNKSVKEIAYELGYEDEHYFSRFFKNNVDVSPQLYRDTVGFARAVA